MNFGLNGMINGGSIFLFLTAAALSGQATFNRIAFGPHPVGFGSYYAYDSSRPAVKEQPERDKGRLLQVNVWYPAKRQGTAILNFNDYVHLIAKETDPLSEDHGFAMEAFYDWTLQQTDATREVVKFKTRGVAMHASLQPEPLSGNFPVVLAMHGGAADVAFMAEFLASHGYIVVNTPTKGYLHTALDVEVSGMDTQIRDFEFALGWLESGKHPFTTGKVAVVGISFGGQSALSYSFKHDVSAVVSLDGGIGSVFGASLVRSYDNQAVSKIRTPLMHLYNPNDPDTDTSFIKGYTHCTRTLISMREMEHAHFWSWGILDRYIPNVINNVRPGDSYEAVLQETLNFISFHTGKPRPPCDWCIEFQERREVIGKEY